MRRTLRRRMSKEEFAEYKKSMREAEERFDEADRRRTSKDDAEDD